MKFSYEIKDVFDCSIERAFKSPILGDATKFMKGYLFQPPVIGFEDDKNWGQINGKRYPINNGNFLVKIQIKGIMKRALMGIKEQAQSNDPFIYELHNNG